MGRKRVEIKRIENSTNRQVTFSKRRNGLLKEAHEIAILCNVQIALLMSSPSGRLSYFSSQKRIEDVFARFANLSDREREDALAPQCLNEEQSRRVATTTEIEEAWQEIRILLQQLQIAEGHLRMFEPDLSRMTSIEDIEAHEKHLEDLLNRVVERKNCLMSHVGSSQNYPTALQETCSSSSHQRPGSFGVDAVNWLPDNGHSMQASDSAKPTTSIRDSFPIICIPSQETSCNVNVEKGEDCCSGTSRHEIPSHSRDSTVLQGTDVSYFATQVPQRK